MNRLRQMFADTVKGLSALSSRDKMLIASLVTIAVMVLVIIAGVTSRTNMVPLYPAGTAAGKQSEAMAMVQARGIDAEMRGSALYVPEERKYEILGLLGSEGKLDAEATVLFDSLANKQHWMNSGRDNDRWFMIAKQNELARVISNFRGIRAAKVAIDVPDNPGMLAAYRKPTAHVTVTATEPLTPARVNAIAGLVAGATAGLSKADVRVADTTTGQEYKPQNEGEMAGTDYLDSVGRIEGRIREKIGEALRYIPGVIVTVNAQVDLRRTTTATNEILPIRKGEAGSLSTPSKTVVDSTTSGGGGGIGGFAGVQANLSAVINAGNGGGGTTSEMSKEETTFSVTPGTRTQQTVDARGGPTKLNVTVAVPQEYVSALVRAGKGGESKDAKEAPASKADLDTAFADEKKRIAAEVEPLVETALNTEGSGPKQQPGTVVVSMIPVPFKPAADALAGNIGGVAQSAGVGGMLDSLGGTGLVKQGVLVAFAAIALTMMFMLVRKAGKPVSLPTPEEIVGVPPTLEGVSDVVGEADEGETAMEGIELDSGRVRTKKMLEQVSDLVKNNPGDAAGLMNRWINREE
ncbi:MAG: flagellar M-ring protein FliF C-terminal domain-containing protein [Phycisphaerales bacterium]